MFKCNYKVYWQINQWSILDKTDPGAIATFLLGDLIIGLSKRAAIN